VVYEWLGRRAGDRGRFLGVRWAGWVSLQSAVGEGSVGYSGRVANADRGACVVWRKVCPV